MLSYSTTCDHESCSLLWPPAAIRLHVCVCDAESQDVRVPPFLFFSFSFLLFSTATTEPESSMSELNWLTCATLVCCVGRTGDMPLHVCTLHLSRFLRSFGSLHLYVRFLPLNFPLPLGLPLPSKVARAMRSDIQILLRTSTSTWRV